MIDPLPGPPPAIDRRVLRDRRARPTPLESVFRPTGLRQAFRRRGEGKNQYVDCPSASISTLTIIVVLLSTIDAFFTLLHIQAGGTEANPVMRAALAMGIPVFVSLKAWITCVGALVLALHERFRLGRIGMSVAVACYAALLIYHVLLLARLRG
ncbi:MAG TPA: DUF5658 family protein [Planctomycetota bacterium]|jgi:hypothetical protein|nr:DUF5658 family protein [Planctomycetota bacterium]